MRKRDYQKKVAIKTNDPAEWSKYKQLRNEINILTRQTKTNYYKEKLSDKTSASKETWRVINEVTGRNFKKTQ